jgi:hypothetical protein
MVQAGTATKVPVVEVTGGAYRSVFGHLSLLLDIAWLPLLILLAATILPGYLELYRGLPGPPPWAGDQFGLGVENLIEALVSLLCLSAFAVRWYQTLLQPGRQDIAIGIFAGAWIRFLVYIVLLYLVAAALLAAALVTDTDTAPSYVGPIAGVVVLAVWLATVRCSLVFPATAIGVPLSPVAAWHKMRGNTWRLLGTMLLVSVPVVFVVALIFGVIVTGFHIDNFADDAPPLGLFLLRGVISACANFLVVALNGAALAGFYRRLANTRAD